MRTILFFVVICFLFHSRVKASHAAGAELTYKWVSDSTYIITYHLFRDCVGIPESTTADICIHNSNGNNYAISLSKDSLLPNGRLNGSEMMLSCPSNKNTCNGGTVPGYREWSYSGKYTLSERADTWVFSHSESDRNAAVINLLTPSSYPSVISATLNYKDAPSNSSPYFTNLPVPFICNNTPYTYNNGVLEPDGDSLYFENMIPQGSMSSDCSSGNMLYRTGFSLPSNPLACAGTYVLNPTTGQMSFTPDSIGEYALTIRVSEYRNISGTWKKVGSVIRDLQIVVTACNRPTPSFTLLDTSVHGAMYSGTNIQACVGATFSFSYYIKSSDTAAILSIYDNSNAIGDISNYKNNFTDSVFGHFSWTPKDADTGMKIFTITSFDSTCNGAALVIAATNAIPIYIWPATKIASVDTICPGDSVKLNAYGGSNFTWTVVPGGSPASSLTCTNCRSPWVKPTITTRYAVQSTNAHCKNTDTVIVPVGIVYAPTVSLSMIPSGGIKPADTVTFTATVTHGGPHPQYRWFKNGTWIPGDTTNILITTGLLPGDAIMVFLQASEKCNNPDTATAYRKVLNVETNNTILQVVVFPNPTTGVVAIKGVLNSPVSNSIVEIKNVFGQIIATNILPSVGNNIDAQIKLPSQIPNGVYSIRLITGNNVFTNSIILKR